MICSVSGNRIIIIIIIIYKELVTETDIGEVDRLLGINQFKERFVIVCYMHLLLCLYYAPEKGSVARRIGSATD